MTQARLLRVHGAVQGVGFRPFVYRLARSHGLRGWVLNAGEGVQIHVEGDAPAVDRFVQDLQEQPPPASRIADVAVAVADLQGFADFEIRDSEADAEALARMIALTGQRTVPVLVEDGRVVQIGWQGRGCIVATAP